MEFSHIINRLLNTIVLLCIMAFSSHAQGNLDTRIKSIMDEHDAIGAAVVVIKGKDVVYSRSFGYNPNYEHPELREPIPENGAFWLASISKTFISVAIMQLVEKGKLRLDDDVNEYLPFPLRNPLYSNEPITVRMLLCHRSGMNDSQGSRSFDAFMRGGETYAKNFNPDCPGTAYHYCNLGYTFLGAIIESVTGERFYEYIERRIIKPIGIKGSFDLTQIEPERLVRSYRFDVKKGFVPAKVYDYSTVRKVLEDYKLGVSTGRLSPAGGMRISALDLAKFMYMLMNGGRYGWRRILKKDSIIEMCTPQGKETNYGLALTTYSSIVKGKRLIGMRGGSHGIHSIMVYDPNKKVGFVVINNGYDTTARNGADMNYRIIRLLYQQFATD